MKRLLRRWRRDFLRYWSALNLVLRLLVLAVLTLAIASLWSRHIAQPLAKTVAALAKGLPSAMPGTPEQDDAVQANRFRAQEVAGSIVTWEKNLAAARLSNVNDDPGVELQAESALQKLASDHRLAVLSAKHGPAVLLPVRDAKPPAPPKGATARPKGEAAKPAGATAKPPAESPIQRYERHYVFAGGFADILAFLEALAGLPFRCELTELHVGESPRFAVDSRRPETLATGLLYLEFNITVLHLHP